MPNVHSKLTAPMAYTLHSAAKHGRCPSVTINPGDNDVGINQLATIRKVPAYVAHVEGGYIVEGKANAKAEEAAAKAQAELEAAAKLAEKGGAQ